MAEHSFHSPDSCQDVINCEDLSQRDQRALVLHLLYAMDAFDYDTSLESVVENIAYGYGYSIPRDSAVFTTTQSIINEREALDKEIQPLLANWRFERLGVVTRLILRYAFWELLHSDTAPNIVINEAVELAKSFAEKDAYKFINGVLDEWRKKHEQ